MTAPNLAHRRTAFTVTLNLIIISPLYALEKHSFPQKDVLPGHSYQLVLSEERPSYDWAIKHQKSKPFKLKYNPLSLPTKIDLSHDVYSIHSQGDLGSCTAQTMTLSLEYYLKRLGTPVELSPLFVYFNGRKVSDSIEEDSGASLTDAIRAVYKYGACLEKTWTYSDKGIKFKTTPPDEAYQEARSIFTGKRLTHTKVPHQIKNIQQSLADKIPVLCGINIFPSFEYQTAKSTGVIPMPSGFETPIGAHALTLVGYDDATEHFKFVNSWGKRWGDNGFGYLPYNYVQNKNPDNSIMHTYPKELWSISLSQADNQDGSPMEKS